MLKNDDNKERKNQTMEQKEIVDRETYKKIKKMDRDTLCKFIMQFGNEIFSQRLKKIDFPALESELSKINGIGDKRLEEIMSVIKKYWDVK